MVVIPRTAHEVISGRQVLNLDTGAGGVDSFALCTVFHRCIHASDFSVAAAHGGGRDTDQAVRRFLRGFADAPRRGHGLSAAVRPFAGLGCDANGVIARVRGGVAGDVHCGGIIAAHGCGMLGAIVGVGSGDADAGLGGIGRRRRCVLLEDSLDLHVVVRHEELVVLDGHAAAHDLPLLEVVALVGRSGQGDRRTGRSFCGRGGSRSVALCGHGDGMLGRRGFGYRNRQLLRIAARAVSSLDGEGGGSFRSRRAADLTGIRVQAQTGRQTAVNAPCDRCCAGGGQGLAVCLAHLAVRQGVRGDGGCSIGGIDRHRAGGSEQTVMCGGGNDSRPACHGGDNAVLGNRGDSLVVGGPAHLFVGGVIRRHGGGQGLAPAHIKGDAALVQRYAGDRDHFVVVIKIDRFLRYVSGLVGRDKLICAAFFIRSAKRN